MSQAVPPHKVTTGDLGEPLRRGLGLQTLSHSGVAAGRGAAAMHGLVSSVVSVLLERGFGRHLVALLVWCSPRAASSGRVCPALCNSPAATSPVGVHVTPGFVPLSIPCLDTARGSAEHSTEAFRPQGGSACWLF